MIIRNERPNDRAAIRGLVDSAFAGMAHSNQREGELVDLLRGAGALAASIVAEDEGTVVGHVALSEVTIAGRDCGWYGLGPLAVLPERQRQGIGTALVRTALTRLQQWSACGCALAGDAGFYGRFGFTPDANLLIDGIPPQHALFLRFGGETVAGSVGYHPAFAAVS